MGLGSSAQAGGEGSGTNREKSTNEAYSSPGRDAEVSLLSRESLEKAEHQHGTSEETTSFSTEISDPPLTCRIRTVIT